VSDVFQAEWLDRSVALLRAGQVDDGFTRKAGPHEEVARFRAQRTDVSDGEQVRVAQQGGSLNARFLVRSTPTTRGIQLSDQLESAGERFEVTGNKEASRFGRGVAREITATILR